MGKVVCWAHDVRGDIGGERRQAERDHGDNQNGWVFELAQNDDSGPTSVAP